MDELEALEAEMVQALVDDDTGAYEKLSAKWFEVFDHRRGVAAGMQERRVTRSAEAELRTKIDALRAKVAAADALLAGESDPQARAAAHGERIYAATLAADLEQAAPFAGQSDEQLVLALEQAELAQEDALERGREYGLKDQPAHAAVAGREAEEARERSMGLMAEISRRKTAADLRNLVDVRAAREAEAEIDEEDKAAIIGLEANEFMSRSEVSKIRRDLETSRAERLEQRTRETAATMREELEAGVKRRLGHAT